MMFNDDYREWRDLDGSQKLMLIKKFKQIVVEITTTQNGVKVNERDYQQLRSVIVDGSDIKPPEMIMLCSNAQGLFKYVQYQGGYDERRAYIEKEFAPLIAILDGSPCDTAISETLAFVNIERVREAWIKCIERRQTDPSGAVTAAKTLLETVLKHIIHDEQCVSNDKDDLTDLYKKAVKKMNLHPTQAVDTQYRDFLQGCTGIVNPLGSIRNKTADAHGKGPGSVAVTIDEATLIVNVAGSLAAFLLAKWKDKEEKNHKLF